MSKQTEVERFAQAVIKNADYRKQIHALGSDLKAVVRVANEHGYDLSMDAILFQTTITPNHRAGSPHYDEKEDVMDEQHNKKDVSTEIPDNQREQNVPQQCEEDLTDNQLDSISAGVARFRPGKALRDSIS